jgi:hypothetical protein
VKKSSFYFILLLVHGGSGSVLIITDPDPGRPKTYGSGSATLTNTIRK